jgi:uncharacterized protein DUF6299
MKRAAPVFSIAALLSIGLVTPVLAAAPSNDLYADRTVIPATPYTDLVDTTEATTDGDDAEANASCGAPATDASVWYEFTAAADAGLVVETWESSYSVGLLAAVGGPGSFQTIACGPGAISFATAAGETYAILAFDFDSDGVNGGSLALSVRDMPPPPELELTIDQVGSFNRSGAATVRGTVTCTGGDEFSKTFIDLQASQLVGRFQINGYGFATFACDGATHAWAGEVFSDSGKFGGGKASVRAFGFVCTESGCDEQELTATITLRR